MGNMLGFQDFYLPVKHEHTHGSTHGLPQPPASWHQSACSVTLYVFTMSKVPDIWTILVPSDDNLEISNVKKH